MRRVIKVQVAPTWQRNVYAPLWSSRRCLMLLTGSIFRAAVSKSRFLSSLPFLSSVQTSISSWLKAKLQSSPNLQRPIGLSGTKEPHNHFVTGYKLYDPFDPLLNHKSVPLVTSQKVTLLRSETDSLGLIFLHTVYSEGDWTTDWFLKQCS